MIGVEVVTASAGDQDAVLDILRAATATATAAGAGARASTWGREFPDVIRDLPGGQPLPAGLVSLQASGTGPRDARNYYPRLRPVLGHEDGRMGDRPTVIEVGRPDLRDPAV
jgi:hypothetical protein